MTVTKKSGIYKITCQVNSKIHGIYVGQSKSLTRRFSQHLRKLKQNNHVNPILQSLYSKYGESRFKFEVLEYCDENDLTQREQHWLNHYRKQGIKTCNIGEFVQATMKGQTHTTEAKAKISKANKGKKVSPEVKKRLHEVNFGKKLSQSTKDKLKGVGTLTEPHVVRKIRDYHKRKWTQASLCRKFNIPPSRMSRILNHKSPYDYD